jgi:CHAT domain-containing protein
MIIMICIDNVTIPFGPEENPLIVNNPVIYCASTAILSKCVSNARLNQKCTYRAAALARFGPDDPLEEARMRIVAESAMNYFGENTVSYGRNLTRDAFTRQCRDVNLLHYHGHASLDTQDSKDRALVLEPLLTLSPTDSGLFTIMDIFEIQLSAATVVLLACTSGEEDISPNDNPLGMLSAFMYAGASTVIATLWPTQTSDARGFSDKFYRYAFANRKGGGLVDIYLAKAMEQTVRDLREEWDDDEPYHWAQFQLRAS